MYKAKLLGNTKADDVNGILKNTVFVMSLKYLSNFWRSLETPLIGCKGESKLKWINQCILLENVKDTDDSNSNNIGFIFIF